MQQLSRKEVMVVGTCVVAGEMARGEYPFEAALFCLLTTLLSETGKHFVTDEF